MAQIDSRLLRAIESRSGLSKSQVYARIAQIAKRDFLPPDLAAIKFAADQGVTINRYATAEQLAQLRQAGSPVAPPAGDGTPPLAARPGRGPNRARLGRVQRRPVPNQVFVVHGRDRAARDAMFSFLRSVGVHPIEWNSAVGMSRKAAPYVGQVIDAGFGNARAIVVLFTPDDLVRLRPDLLSHLDPAFERREMGQARPNVLFEAGRAFSSHPDRTILVQLGSVRPFSDVAGVHLVHMSNEVERRQELVTKLRNAGCAVNTSGTDWLREGDFTDPEARSPRGAAPSMAKGRARPRRK